MISRLLNRSKDLAFVPAMDAFWRRRASGRLVCLLYHRVLPREQHGFLERFGAPAITPEALARDLGLLARQGVRFMSFSDLRAGRHPDAKEFGVIVSFDDGLRDNYEHGLPVLEGLGIRGIVFQSSALVDASRLIWEHALYWLADSPVHAPKLREALVARCGADAMRALPELVAWTRENVDPEVIEAMLDSLRESHGLREEEAELARRLYPRAQDLREAEARGHEIGSHGHEHYKRGSISDAKFETELQASSRRLGEILGHAPAAFSYPFNSREAADRLTCGRYFAQVATVDSQPIAPGGDPLAIPRFTWPGPPCGELRTRRWLWTGRI